MKDQTKYDKITDDYQKAKIEFVKAANKYLHTFMPLSAEDEEEDLLTILGLLGFEFRRKHGNFSEMWRLSKNAQKG